MWKRRNPYENSAMCEQLKLFTKGGILGHFQWKMNSYSEISCSNTPYNRKKCNCLR